METKTAVDWKKGVNDIVQALGEPKIIMTDPDYSVFSMRWTSGLGTIKTCSAR